MASRINPGPLVAALGALLLLVSLILDWYEPGYSAWTVFEAHDLLLAAVALAALAIGLAALGVLAGPLRALGSYGRALPVLGVLALVVVVSQLLNHPPAAVGRDPELGAWLGLVGAVVLTPGGALSIARVSVDLDYAAAAARGPGGGPGTGAGPGPPGGERTQPMPPGAGERPPAEPPPTGRPGERPPPGGPV